MESSIYEISYKLRKELHRKIFIAALTVLSLVTVISLFMTFVLFPVMQTSVSMEPSVSENTVSFVTPLIREPGRGELMFLKPASRVKNGLLKRGLNTFAGFFTGRQFFPWTSSKTVSGNGSIRRVIGLPGDTIFLEDYILHIKPKGSDVFLTEFELTEYNYSIKLEAAKEDWDGEMGSVSKIEEFVLGNDEYFVLGDNRNVCLDSRTWGAIKKSRIQGKVLLTYLPVQKFKAYGF